MITRRLVIDPVVLQNQNIEFEVLSCRKISDPSTLFMTKYKS